MKKAQKMQQPKNDGDFKKIGDVIGVDWKKYDLDQFIRGYAVELEHGAHDKQTDVTHDDPIITGKIVFAHLKEIPNYYDLLEKVERKARK